MLEKNSRHPVYCTSCRRVTQQVLKELPTQGYRAFFRCPCNNETFTTPDPQALVKSN